MRSAFFTLAGLGACLLAAPAPAQVSLGVFGQWGAFTRPGSCYAISEPTRARRTGGWRPFASIGHWPARRVSGQLHIRLSGEKRPNSAVLARIDGRSFQLRGTGREAWAANEAGDEAILGAMRTGLEMVIETRSVRGQLIRDVYQLRGAATAMDAAALACRPRR